ncbi:MAG TPA: hypothetical protein VEA37_05700, partial [Flavobacterium sp.]|nr:hypothetical protein [Flavobacterium sp.]
ASRHVFIIKVKGQSPNKFNSLAVRSLIAIALILWEVVMLEKWWLQMFLTYLSTGGWIHNTLIAWRLGRKVWYLNGTGVIDRRLKPYSFPFWVCLTIAGLALTAMYFFNEPI